MCVYQILSFILWAVKIVLTQKVGIFSKVCQIPSFPLNGMFWAKALENHLNLTALLLFTDYQLMMKVEVLQNSFNEYFSNMYVHQGPIP